MLQKKSITSFYYYYDTCSVNNTFKIIAVTNFNEKYLFSSDLNDKIEISIISPFESKATCQLSSKVLEPYIEFNCQINDNTIIINSFLSFIYINYFLRNKSNYKTITFGKVLTNTYYNIDQPIIIEDFEGKKEFGSYCSQTKSKCSQIIENDYNYNSINIDNPKVYKYSFCLISDKSSELNKKNFQVLFNNNTIGNCSINNNQKYK